SSLSLACVYSAQSAVSAHGQGNGNAQDPGTAPLTWRPRLSQSPRISALWADRDRPAVAGRGPRGAAWRLAHTGTRSPDQNGKRGLARIRWTKFRRSDAHRT